jgi:chaperonin GroEL
MIIHGKEVKQKLLQGINLVADTVKPTLGPQAKTVILQGNPPVIINDGVTITKYISHPDPYVSLGVKMVQNLAMQAQQNAGDGTTTACIIAQALCNGLAKLDTSDLHHLRLEMESIRNTVLNTLSEQAIEVTEETIIDVATIASNNDVKMGKLIAEVLSHVGKDGVITVEEGNQLETSYEVKEGLEVDEGYFSHLMANDPSGVCELRSPLVLATNMHLTNFSDLLPVLELASAQGKPILIFCKNIQGPALNNTIMNIVDGRIQACIVTAPNFGDAQLDELGDIVSLLGGNVFSDENNSDISKVTLEDLGTCEKAIITSSNTTLVGGEGDVSDKISSLKSRYEEIETNYDRMRIKKRLSRLQGGVAVITVGAGSSMEMRETKERLDDALNATKAALQEGIVLGAGRALWDASKELDIDGNVELNRIVIDSLKTPQLILSGDVPLVRLKNNQGWNAVKGEYVDLLEDGIIDPVKVTKSSFSVAMSIAMLFLTTEVAVLLPEE